MACTQQNHWVMYKNSCTNSSGVLQKTMLAMAHRVMCTKNLRRMHLINGFPNPWRSGVWLGNPLSLVFLVTFVNALPWTDEFMGVGNPAPAACFPCAPRIPLKLWKHYLPVLRILPSIPRSHVLLCWNCAPCKPHAHQCHPRTPVPQNNNVINTHNCTSHCHDARYLIHDKSWQ